MLAQRRALVGVFYRSISSVSFPNERYGVDYATNWAVASCGVTATGSAFRNPTQKTLLANSPNVDKKSKVISRDTKPASVFVDMDDSTFEEITNECRASFDGRAAFLVDASAGGSKNLAVSTRCVTDCASFAMVLQTLLCKTPAKAAQDFRAQVFLLHASEADAAAGGPYCAVRGNQVICRGNVDAGAVSEAIAVAAGTVLLESTAGIVLPGSVTVTSDGKTAVNIAKGSSYFVWGSSGVTGLFDARIEPKKSVGATVVETSGAVVPFRYPSSLMSVPSQVSFDGVVVSDEAAAKTVFSKFALLEGKEEALWDTLIAAAKPSFKK